MTIKTVKLTSHDVPQWLRDKINAMSTLEEVEAYRSTVKSPNQCRAGDPDLQVWHACTAVLSGQRSGSTTKHVPTDHELRVIEWVNSDGYDNE